MDVEWEWVGGWLYSSGAGVCVCLFVLLPAAQTAISNPMDLLLAAGVSVDAAASTLQSTARDGCVVPVRSDKLAASSIL